MTQKWGHATPEGRGGPGDAPDIGHAYAMWDAAYVLGSLSATDQEEFEGHLSECPWCQGAVADLEGVPALLSHLDLEDVALLDADRDENPLPALSAPRRHYRPRLSWVSSAAAAAVLATGVFVGVATQSPPPAKVAAMPMAQVNTALLASTVSLSDQDWGTLIELRCVCLADSSAPHDLLAMVVVGRDGSRNRLASWVANPGHTATPTGSTSMSADQIASVQVVSADSGDVLLQRTL